MSHMYIYFCVTTCHSYTPTISHLLGVISRFQTSYELTSGILSAKEDGVEQPVITSIYQDMEEIYQELSGEAQNTQT